MLDDYNGFYYGVNERISLTLREVEILAYLIDNRNKIIPLEDISEEIYGKSDNKHYQRIRFFICKLNEKLVGEIWIRGIYNLGYKLEYLAKKSKT